MDEVQADEELVLAGREFATTWVSKTLLYNVPFAIVDLASV
jgi:hypothetical protein